MLRTQVQLTEEQVRRLRVFARREGVSIAHAVRMSVDQMLDRQSLDKSTLYSRAADLIGKYDEPDQLSDLSSRHDDYLDEADR